MYVLTNKYLYLVPRYSVANSGLSPYVVLPPYCLRTSTCDAGSGGEDTRKYLKSVVKGAQPKHSSGVLVPVAPLLDWHQLRTM
jgi:hypothetical protein